MHTIHFVKSPPYYFPMSGARFYPQINYHQTPSFLNNVYNYIRHLMMQQNFTHQYYIKISPFYPNAYLFFIGRCELIFSIKFCYLRKTNLLTNTLFPTMKSLLTKNAPRSCSSYLGINCNLDAPSIFFQISYFVFPIFALVPYAYISNKSSNEISIPASFSSFLRKSYNCLSISTLSFP